MRFRVSAITERTRAEVSRLKENPLQRQRPFDGARHTSTPHAPIMEARKIRVYIEASGAEASADDTCGGNTRLGYSQTLKLWGKFHLRAHPSRETARARRISHKHRYGAGFGLRRAGGAT